MKPSFSRPAATPNTPARIASTAATLTARCGSPAASGTTAAAIIGASEESGPSTRMRLGPASA
jgi:hypothetical protein